MALITQTRLYIFQFIELLPSYRRLIVAVLIVVFLTLPSTRELTLGVLSDAFWQVAVFVAMTLMIYHLVANRISKLALFKGVEFQGKWKVVFAAAMGVLPGCGGAIVVITQFVSGSMSFGAVVAVLTATMGDAAFLLLAAEPKTGGFVIALSLTVGLVSGLIVDRIHGENFLRPLSEGLKKQANENRRFLKQSKRIKSQGVMWQWLVLPGAAIGLLMAAQQDVTSLLFISNEFIQILGATIVLVLVVLWATTTEVKDYESIVAEDKKSTHSKTFQRVALDTNFVTSWVVIAFLMFELLIFYTQLDLRLLFGSIPAVMPFIGVIIGMIPGCGPQIITTSLYLSGAVPLSVQIGNAISNDGDALFPAIALSPKVAVVATFYSAIPALVVAYGYYFIYEV